MSSALAPDSVDRRMMVRCIELSREGAAAGELPFGSLVAKHGEILAQSANRAARDGDLSRHAEIVAIAQAQALTDGPKLADCTLYSTVEPCPMCSFCIRAAGIGRVVFALSSPIMGGFSHWSILREDTLAHDLPFGFGKCPEVGAGVLAQEAARVWHDWNPLVWQVIKLRRLLVRPVCALTRRSPERHLGSLRALRRVL